MTYHQVNADFIQPLEDSGVSETPRMLPLHSFLGKCWLPRNRFPSSDGCSDSDSTGPSSDSEEDTDSGGEDAICSQGHVPPTPCAW